MHSQQHEALRVATLSTRCFACIGLCSQGATVHAVAFGYLELWASCGLGEENASSNSHLCLLILIKCPSLGLSLSRKTIWGPLLRSEVKLWLCLHLGPELRIRPHLPAALLLLLRDSLICPNGVGVGVEN